MKDKNLIAVALLTLVGGFLYFYNLAWGNPFYFHPDERNILYAVLQLSFPHQLNPHFFAYGTVPIYAIYIILTFLSFMTHQPITFPLAVIVARFFSALLATLLIPILYLVGKKINNTTTGLFTAALATVSTGFVQFSHFGTFEMWLTFLTVLLFLSCMHLIKNGVFIEIVCAGILSGLLVGTKISSLVLLPLPLIALLLHHLWVRKQKKLRITKRLQIFVKDCLLLVLIATVIFFITNPFVVLDFSSFISSMQYESSVATGSLPVFYTGGFYQTIPFLYQMVHVYPFLLSLPGELLFILCTPLFLFSLISKKRAIDFMIFLFFLVTLTSQVVLFVKWTRYLVPTLPFIYLIIAESSGRLFAKSKQKILEFSFYLISIVSIGLFTIPFFITAYGSPDTRISASEWAMGHIPPTAPVVSEVYDLGIVPFNANFPHITLFNFYDLDSPDGLQNKIILSNTLSQNDYLILPSQRIMKDRIYNGETFPNGHIFYVKLFSGELGFTKIYQTPCTIFCRIAYLGDPIFMYEETTAVFDRPTVFIFKKTRTLSTDEYIKLL